MPWQLEGGVKAFVGAKLYSLTPSANDRRIPIGIPPPFKKFLSCWFSLTMHATVNAGTQRCYNRRPSSLTWAQKLPEVTAACTAKKPCCTT